LLLIISFIGVFYFATLNLFSFSSVNRIGNDSINYILPALAPKFEMGVPYRDYFENNPPGILLLTWGWTSFFGYSNLSFKILHFITLISASFLFYLITKKAFPLFFGPILVIFSSVVLFSPMLDTFLLTSEQIGLCFSLLGLVLLLWIKDDKIFWRFFLASIFLFLASQMKDPFGPVLICLLPPLFFYLVRKESQKFFKAVFAMFLGTALSLGTIIVYLGVIGSLNAYLEMLRLKTEIYHISLSADNLIYRLLSSIQQLKDLVIYPQYSLVFLFFLFFVLFLVKKIINKNASLKESLIIKINLDEKAIIYSILIFYVIGNFIGFELQGKVGSHYLIQMVIPVYILVALVLLSLYKAILPTNLEFSSRFKIHTGILKVSILCLVTLLLFPKYLRSYSHLYKTFSYSKLISNLTEGQKMPPLETYIQNKTSKDDCILSLYGWGTPTTYFYSQRRPCTRFYTPNLITDRNKFEFREQILVHPPAAIFYTKVGADMDIDGFEKNIFNVSKTLKYCYKRDVIYEELFFPASSKEKLTKCISDNGF